jgi:2-oxoglutarate ferredoxin oxidoreductase subunit gamma
MGGSTGDAVERELIITGVGGQGVQLATQVLARAAAREGRRAMMFGIYGGEMRGGRTETTLVVGDGPIGAPPIVSTAWSAVAMHHAFWGLVAPKVVPGGLVLVNATVFEGDLGRDDVETVALPLSATAAELGSVVLVSMVLAGAYAGLTGMVSLDAVLEAMRESVPPYRRQFVPGNERAIRAGADLVPPGIGAAFWQRDAA